MASVRRGVFRKPRRDRGRIARRIITWVIVVGGIVAWVLTAGRWLDHTGTPKRADVVFFLADFADRDAARRTVATFKRTHAKRVIVFVASGGAGPGRAAVKALRTHGVPGEDIRKLGP